MRLQNIVSTTLVLPLLVACGGGMTSSVGTKTPVICEAGPGNPRCDADNVISSFIHIIQGPEERSALDMTSARATLTTLDEARQTIIAAGAITLEERSSISPTPNQVWLIEFRGEFVLRFEGFETPRPGLLYGVEAVNTGAIVLLSFVSD